MDVLMAVSLFGCIIGMFAFARYAQNASPVKARTYHASLSVPTLVLSRQLDRDDSDAVAEAIVEELSKAA